MKKKNYLIKIKLLINVKSMKLSNLFKNHNREKIKGNKIEKYTSQ